MDKDEWAMADRALCMLSCAKMVIVSHRRRVRRLYSNERGPGFLISGVYRQWHHWHDVKIRLNVEEPDVVRRPHIVKGGLHHDIGFLPSCVFTGVLSRN